MAYAAPGALGLDEMIVLAKQAMGGRNTGLMTDAWYETRVNHAYAKLVTFVGPVQAPGMRRPQMRVLRFQELYGVDEQTITAAATSGASPTTNFIESSKANTDAGSVVFVDNVYDLTNDVALSRKSKRWFLRRDPEEEGIPRHFRPAAEMASHTSSLVGYYISPIPGDTSDQILVRETTYQYPDALATGTSEAPVIPSVWHPCIVWIAVADAARLIDWPEKAAEMDAQFMTFLATHRTPLEEAAAAGGRRRFHVGG